MNALEKLTDLFAACILLFMLPLLYYNEKMYLVQEMTAGKICEEFLSRCSLFGEIREEYLEDLERGLSACGCIKYEICGERTVYLYGEGGVIMQYIKKDTDFFISRVREQKDIALIPGDFLSVTVYFHQTPTVYSIIVRSGKEI